MHRLAALDTELALYKNSNKLLGTKDTKKDIAMKMWSITLTIGDAVKKFQSFLNELPPDEAITRAVSLGQRVLLELEDIDNKMITRTD